MSQVRLVQIGSTGIQLGGIGSTLGATPATAGNPIQLGKFNNTTGTFYKDPSNTSGGGAGQQIQMGTNLGSRTLGYITGTGAPSQSVIQTSGYFSIWNNAVVQGASFQLQTPSGNQAKPKGSQALQQSHVPQNQQDIKQQSHVPQNQQDIKQQSHLGANNQDIKQQSHAANNQDIKQQSHVPQNQQDIKQQSHLGANNQDIKQQSHAGIQQDIKQQSHAAGIQQDIRQYHYYVGPIHGDTYYGYPDSQYTDAKGGHYQFYYYYNVDGTQKAHTSPNNQDKPQKSHTSPNNQDKPQKSHLGANNQDTPQKSHAVQNNQDTPQKSHLGANNQDTPQKSHVGANNQDKPQKSHVALNNQDVPIPASNQPSSGTLYNGWWVETQPGGTSQPGSVAGSSILLNIGNIGVLATQGGSFSSAGPATGQYQTSATTFLQSQLTGTNKASIQASQGVILFQAASGPFQGVAINTTQIN